MIIAAVTAAAMPTSAIVIGPIATLSNPNAAASVGNTNNNGPTTSNTPPRAAAVSPITFVRVGCSSAQAMTLRINISIFGSTDSIIGSNISPKTCIKSPNRFFNCVIGSAVASAWPANFSINAVKTACGPAPVSSAIPYRFNADSSPLIARATSTDAPSNFIPVAADMSINGIIACIERS